MTNNLLPALGAWVVLRDTMDAERNPGVVHKIMISNHGASATVQWLRTKQVDVVSLDRLACGFARGHDVLHDPSPGYGPPLGTGVVRAIRDIGGQRQLLVEFASRGERLWMPWQRFRFIKGPAFRFKRGDVGGPDAAERFRLRTLAHALVFWNENTGALSRFDIDPLPHQIHLVHHILASGNLNWLVADDVGLGKTIEAGLIVAALRQRSLASRILIVVPAGLTRQWQEDLKLKFGLDDFLIYGTDFSVGDTAHWKLYDRVIASMDQLKAVAHLGSIMEAEPWDLVIFDEAHRLTRKQKGQSYEKSDRFRLAEHLRHRTRNILMLTATPHQGRQDQFVALLHLLRPELASDMEGIDFDQSLLSRMVFRNRKADVTDAEGNFIFKGQTSRMIQVDANPELTELEDQLAAYLEEGYRAARASGSSTGRAIGFVMTVYRKLAASSIYTLMQALIRRLARLEASSSAKVIEQLEIQDDRFQGEFEEAQETPSAAFFDGEADRLRLLIRGCEVALLDDVKMSAFLSCILAPILSANPNEKLLIFTEYRGTQDYIRHKLEENFGPHKVSVINGGMDVEERIESIRHFEGNGQFLVSTEAGGEGINLQRRCHMLVNFDLPWNPMRLAQRIGRLYRYGQQNHVSAFNLESLASADEGVVAKMYERLEQVARDLATVEEMTRETLISDIVGELAGLLDVEEILEEARGATVKRTSERIDEAIERARQASEVQRDLFHHAVSYQADELKDTLQMGIEHLHAFVGGMIYALGGEVKPSQRFPGMAWRLVLPASVRENLPGLDAETLVAFDRTFAPEGVRFERLDMDHRLVKYLLARSLDYDFEGLTAPIALGEHAGALGLSILHWQDERGRRMRSELTALHQVGGADIQLNPRELSEFLLEPQENAPSGAVQSVSGDFVQAAETRIDRLLAERSTGALLPEGYGWISLARCEQAPESASQLASTAEAKEPIDADQ
ncbi:ATP-dependent helicase [Dyella solisilvae]|uniref:ATP-dependent helicase n=1 Tax=Dyella solisilvae TaxID=1920168 RepID=A0A370K8F5_9GAMM|nr:helicase-related protein [Dyella solisilvae]RDI98941.1 ATP-dependent helicase [Dyella solisilvae]